MPDVSEPFDLILFGASGDLARRKLVPALFDLHRDGRLHAAGTIYAIARTKDNQYLANLIEHEEWGEFYKRIAYVQLDLEQVAGYKRLQQALKNAQRQRIFYTAIHSKLYPILTSQLAHHELITPESRIVLEKPIGNDGTSSAEISSQVAKHFSEPQIFRIDHYLGKETVQNLLALRFANSIFEHQWNQRYIDHIQITISETVGVEQRAGFYEGTGAMRDMLQNHLLQLLCMTAMEPPATMDPEAVREEKVKVLKALKPIVGADIHEKVVRGQYEEGVINENDVTSMVPAYKDEEGVEAQSRTETFVAVKAEIDNWRWAGVPFYLRTGKRLSQRICEIVVHFKEVPHSIFEMQNKLTMANKLIFRLQPDDGIKLQLCEKRVGNHMSVQPMTLSLNPSDSDKKRVPDAYERLLADAINDNATLFLRQDELETAWQWVDPILQSWSETDQRPESYNSGTWGPAASTLLLAKDGRLWEENN